MNMDMPENPFAPKFLAKQQPDLHASKEVESAVRRTKGLGKEVPSQKDKAGKIQTHLDRLEEIFTKGNPDQIEQRLKYFKDVLHKQVIVKPQEISQGYFELQRRIAREQGHGDIEITPEMRKQMTETVIRDQEDSFDAWVDYMASPDATYPTWYKYWIIKNISRLGTYDKAKKQFRKRRRDTADIFPDIDREAVAYVYDELYKKLKGEGEQDAQIDHLERDPEWEKLLKEANFGKLYSYAIEKVTPADQELKETIEGEWVAYKRGSDHRPLVESLQGHGTGWCTAGEQTAKHQLEAGDFHVFYSKDKQGNYTTPRTAIRMANGEIAEVRGIGAGQELEPKLLDTAREKYSTLPGGDEYEKKDSDMKRLTAIEKRHNAGEELSKDELRFLYEIDTKIEGFGYEKDPRIFEIQRNRDPKKDYAFIFDCREDQIALEQDEVKKDTVAVVGDLEIFNDDSLPESIRVITGSILVYKDVINLLSERTAWLLIEAGRGEVVDAEHEAFLYSDLRNIFHRLIEAGISTYNIESDEDNRREILRKEPDHRLFVEDLVKHNRFCTLVRFLPELEDVDHEKLVDSMFENGQGQLIAENIELLQVDKRAAAERLLETAGGAGLVLMHYAAFGIEPNTLAEQMLDKGYVREVAYNLDYKSCQSTKVATALIDNGYIGSVAHNIEEFGLDRHHFIDRIIEQKAIYVLSEDSALRKLVDSMDDIQFMELLRVGLEYGVPEEDEGHPDFSGLEAVENLLDSMEHIEHLDQNEVARILLKHGESGILSKALDKFKNLNQDISRGLIKAGYGVVVTENPKSFQKKEVLPSQRIINELEEYE